MIWPVSWAVVSFSSLISPVSVSTLTSTTWAVYPVTSEPRSEYFPRPTTGWLVRAMRSFQSWDSPVSVRTSLSPLMTSCSSGQFWSSAASLKTYWCASITAMSEAMPPT